MVSATATCVLEGDEVMSVERDILNGDHDSELKGIGDAVQQRRRLIRAEVAAVVMSDIEVGDVVVFREIRPKYMVGEHGKVVGKRRTK